MKTQFHPDSTAKCSWHKAFTGWTKTQSDPIKTQLRPNPVMPCRRTLWLVTQRIRRVVGQFTDYPSEFADSAGTMIREFTDACGGDWMISKLHVYEPDLKTSDGTSNHLAITTPDCLSSRARSRSFGGGSCFFRTRQ